MRREIRTCERDGVRVPYVDRASPTRQAAAAAAASRANQIDPNANAAGRRASPLRCAYGRYAPSAAVYCAVLLDQALRRPWISWAELNVGRQIFRSDCRGQREMHAARR